MKGHRMIREIDKIYDMLYDLMLETGELISALR